MPELAAVMLEVLLDLELLPHVHGLGAIAAMGNGPTEALGKDVVAPERDLGDHAGDGQALTRAVAGFGVRSESEMPVKLRGPCVSAVMVSVPPLAADSVTLIKGSASSAAASSARFPIAPKSMPDTRRCALLETLTTRAGAPARRAGSSNRVSRKCPRWFTP